MSIFRATSKHNSYITELLKIYLVYDRLSGQIRQYLWQRQEAKRSACVFVTSNQPNTRDNRITLSPKTFSDFSSHTKNLFSKAKAEACDSNTNRSSWWEAETNPG